MVFHVSLLVAIISIKNNCLCSNGLAKYKLTKELSQTLNLSISFLLINYFRHLQIVILFLFCKCSINNDIDSNATQPTNKQFGLFETSAKAINNDIEIGPSHNMNKYYTTVESDFESNKKQSDDDGTKKKPTNSTVGKNSQDAKEQEDESQTKKQKKEKKVEKNNH
ncbi:hypothetical protein F8M41_022230 [Gigaspora margarita]|uniref:Uncharacterized protein n=1 Tax=Gigaspora margarita TaxID=4874 RepID=A0A8H4B1C9_GIGMA|nr:hypothetical protein F8M41_022230 [Gigaspora margarita]